MTCKPDRDTASADPGIRCSRCVAICCRLPVLLMGEDRVPRALTAEDERGLLHMARLDDGWCVALDRDSGRCSIYAQRPAICRAFAMGGAECRAERDAWRLAAPVDNPAWGEAPQ